MIEIYWPTGKHVKQPCLSRPALGPTKQTLVLDSSIRTTPGWANFYPLEREGWSREALLLERMVAGRRGVNEQRL
jgi:hypothetical protein